MTPGPDSSWSRQSKRTTRILTKPETVSRFGEIDWSSIPSAAKELLVDLHYRGDLRQSVQSHLFPLLADNRYAEFFSAFQDKLYWQRLGVPGDRFERRAEIASIATGDE